MLSFMTRNYFLSILQLPSVCFVLEIGLPQEDRSLTSLAMSNDTTEYIFCICFGKKQRCVNKIQGVRLHQPTQLFKKFLLKSVSCLVEKKILSKQKPGLIIKNSRSNFLRLKYGNHYNIQ